MVVRDDGWVEGLAKVLWFKGVEEILLLISVLYLIHSGC